VQIGRANSSGMERGNGLAVADCTTWQGCHIAVRVLSGHIFLTSNRLWRLRPKFLRLSGAPEVRRNSPLRLCKSEAKSCHITKTKIEMAIDPLKCRNHDTFLRRGPRETCGRVRSFRYVCVSRPLGEPSLYAPQFVPDSARGFRINSGKLGGTREIPFVGQPSTPNCGSPSALLNSPPHHPADSRGIAGGVKIKIGTEVRPVIE